MKKKTITDAITDEAQRANSDVEDSILLSRAEKTFYCIIATAIGALVLYYMQFGWPQHRNLDTTTWSGFISVLSGRTDSWGQFGDFLGGLLNPLVGIGTIYLILINVRLQKRELRAALIEMRNSNQSLEFQNDAISIQNFQNTFFNWISSYREVIGNAQFRGHDGLLYGAPALRSLYRGNFHGSELEFLFKADEIESAFAPFSNYDHVLDEITNQKIDGILMLRWSEFKSNYHAAESSTKSIVGLIDWILKYAPTIRIKHEYLNILASQLSLIEITFILYESFTSKGIRLSQLNFHKFFDKISKFDDPSTYYIRIRAIGATPYLSTYDE